MFTDLCRSHAIKPMPDDGDPEPPSPDIGFCIIELGSLMGRRTIGSADMQPDEESADMQHAAACDQYLCVLQLVGLSQKFRNFFRK